MNQRPSKTASVTSAAGINFHKLNTKKWESRDAYHWLLTLTWTKFSAFVLVTYLALNLFFALLYHVSPGCIAEMNPNSWGEPFFFSVETLATVGYGHFYPATLYGHVVSTLEIMAGMFGMAIITGLIFIRFSRPVARIVFSKVMVLSTFDGKPALIFRIANLRDQAMAEAEFRVILMRNEPTKEGEVFRRFYPLQLQFDRLILFPAIITIRHIIDEHSPLFGQTFAHLQDSDARIAASIVCIDTVVPAPVQSHLTYGWRDIIVNHKFVEVYTEISEKTMTVDYALFHTTEPVSAARPNPS